MIGEDRLQGLESTKPKRPDQGRSLSPQTEQIGSDVLAPFDESSEGNMFELQIGLKNYAVKH